MSIVVNGIHLLSDVINGDFNAVKAALDAGESVNRHPDQAYGPIVAATMVDHVAMVKFLLDKGAHPDDPITKKVSCPTIGIVRTTPGERALHLAAKRGNIEIANLLTRALADPNVTDETGCTPLFYACESPHIRVDMVRLLLGAGANPALAEETGFTPLHLAAHGGHMEVFHVLHSGQPATLNSCTTEGFTPLFIVCANGHERMVSQVLSLGAMQPTPLKDSNTCPLSIATNHGSVDVVRVLVNEGGVRAVGGRPALINALVVAVQARQTRILLLLLTAEGDGNRSAWANANVDGYSLLHYGASCCCPPVVSVLLGAGADETVRDSKRRVARNVIGVVLEEGEPQSDPGKEVAIRRMLQRAPAYRARSWVWPSHEEAKDAGSRGDGDTAASAAATTDANVLSPPPAMLKTSRVVGVRTFRPKKSSSSRLFVRAINRYCAKG